MDRFVDHNGRTYYVVFGSVFYSFNEALSYLQDINN